MSETLKQLFPNIRTEEAIIGEIKSDENLLAEYESWTELQQRDFLKFCSGMRGVKVLYDGFGKEILSPIYHPERLEELLSCILETEVKIRQVIPSDGTRIADEQSLVIMDIVDIFFRESGVRAIPPICFFGSIRVSRAEKREILHIVM